MTVAMNFAGPTGGVVGDNGLTGGRFGTVAWTRSLRTIPGVGGVSLIMGETTAGFGKNTVGFVTTGTTVTGGVTTLAGTDATGSLTGVGLDTGGKITSIELAPLAPPLPP